MDELKQRIAIATECGWSDFKQTAPDRGSMNPRIIARHNGSGPKFIPDYLHDLNAMQSAVVSQSEEFQDRFDYQIRSIGKRVVSISASEMADIFCGLINANSLK